MSRSLLGGATLTLRFSPMMTGLVVGVVFGDISHAMIVTAAIQLIYMGVFSPGGQMPSEPAVATAIAVPVALLGNMSPATAVGVAVPVGLLGSYLYQFRFFINTFVMQKFVDKAAAAGSGNGLTFSIIIIPIICAFIIYVPFMFASLYYGAPFIAEIIQSNSSSFVFHILNVIGGGLAAVGIAVTVYVIGKRSYVVFFLLAYFAAVIAKPLNVTMVTYAIVGSIIAFIFVLVKSEIFKTIGTGGSSNNTASKSDDNDDY